VSILPYLVAGWLFLIGLYGIVTSRNLIHLVMCLAVLQSSTYVFLVAIGYRFGGGPPVFATVPVGTPAVDPVVQALLLTDIVVEATVVALLLSFAIQIHKNTATLNPDKVVQLEG
jgi:multicomponent Na+:H+ antiporter subunit C